MSSSIYLDLIKQLPHVLEGELHFITNMANFSSLLFNSLENLNWVGFYLKTGDELILGPFQGKPACVRIKIGKGVCGTSAEKIETVVVDDVHEFPGHIACDSASNSEIVIPLVKDGILLGVLDIDSPILRRFSAEDKVYLEELLSILVKNTDWRQVNLIY